MSAHDAALPWKWVAVEGGWDGVADANGQIVCRLGLNVPKNAALIVAAVNERASLVSALRDLLDNPLDMHAQARAASVLARVEAER